MSLLDQVKQAGVVGAGGGGFPTHVKLGAKAETVIVNGAECEPLMYKDVVLMEIRAEELLEGLELAMAAVGAKRGVVGVKAKNQEAVAALRKAIGTRAIELKLLGDYYPAGDEYDLVYEVTGKLIPPGGIPLAVGAIVSNVETILNIAGASKGRPVTQKTLTVSGAVRKPCTLVAPLGTSLRACLEAAGGATVPGPALCVGGMMMGETTVDLDRAVTKTTGGLIVLPREHPVVQRKLTPLASMNRIGKSACDQCRFCTELCPRFLLGYPVEPHQVMRSLAFTATGSQQWNEWAALCCSCGLCTLYACPEALYPKEACDQSKAELKKAKWTYQGPTSLKVHPLREGRRVPIKLLKQRLALDAYDQEALVLTEPLKPVEVRLAFRQGAGAPGQPLVKAGDRLAEGQVLTRQPEGTLGSVVHAPFAGTVVSLDASGLLLRRS